MKALIDPNSVVSHVALWTWAGSVVEPTIETYPNSARVCEVVENEFPVAEPLFWVDCDQNVIPDQFYFDTEAQQILPVQNAEPPPKPESQIPVTET